MVNLIPGGGHTAVNTRPLRTTEKKRNNDSVDRSEFAPPSRPSTSYIPSPSVLEDLIGRALQALSRGIYWDRGSIINIVL